jgi:hypothetical protein
LIGFIIAQRLRGQILMQYYNVEQRWLWKLPIYPISIPQQDFFLQQQLIRREKQRLPSEVKPKVD